MNRNRPNMPKGTWAFDDALEFEADTGEDLVAEAQRVEGDGGLDFFSLSLDMD